MGAYSQDRFIRKHLGLLTVAVSLCLLAIMMAKRCVKRPNLEPTPGISSLTLVIEHRQQCSCPSLMIVHRQDTRSFQEFPSTP
ncbi:MAG TPA: hypothetical protein DD706_01240 [Nitrospiraceae bacterium]|nr:hypothetical protein [Nitrospiraceae bacterium]